MTEQDDPYVPVDCGLHSGYELAIMHKAALQLTWLDQYKQQHEERLMPLDLKTKDHKEYLIARSSSGEMHEIRLDKIKQSDVSEVIKT